MGYDDAAFAPVSSPVTRRPAESAPAADVEAPSAPPVEPDAAPTPDGEQPDSSAQTTAPAEPESKGRARGMAVNGKTADLPAPPPRPTWPGAVSADDDYVPDEQFDAHDLSDVNRELNRCRSRLFRISQALKGAQRNLADAELAYNRAYRRALIAVSGGSAETRKAYAEVQCEQFENDLAVARQVVEELKKRSMDARDDLKAVENLSHNVRAQMDIR